MLELDKIKKYEKEYRAKKENKVRERMVRNVALVDLIHDLDTDTNDNNFSITITTHGVINQKQSGRCWSFAGLNILREKVIEKCNLDNFELSGSYLAFYDKLERVNVLLERLIKYKNEKKDLYDRYVSDLLKKGLQDSGYFNQFAQLVKKYGVVPYNNFPETFTSSHTYEINQILSRLIRKFYLELEDVDDCNKLKDEYMKKAYTIVVSLYGLPPEKFDFSYTDKDNRYCIDRNLTPVEFYEKYIGIDLESEYVEIGSYTDNLFKYNHRYQIEESSKISGGKDEVLLNLPEEEFNNLILKQIKGYEPVYFFCSTTSKRIEGTWIDTIERYGDIFDIDLVFNRNEISKTNAITESHIMLITGVDLVDNQPKKWKIENTWGENFGKNGQYVATNDWLNRYVFKICINKKYLTDRQLNLLKKPPILVRKWDEKF